MGDVLFLQFYSVSKNGYFDLCNGFSDTHDLCRERGDFHWLRHDADRDDWLSEARYQGRPLPIAKGTIYASALTVDHLYQAYVWAREYPEIRFVVGGPAAAERDAGGTAWSPLYVRVDTAEPWPDNLIFTGASVEQWFGVPEFSGQWRLPVPDCVPPDAQIYLSYTLDNSCYWRKCVYCNIALHAEGLFRSRSELGFEFQEVAHPGVKIVRLNTGSIRPRQIRELLPRLPQRDDLVYRTFLRSAPGENQALRSALAGGADFSKILFGLGIEFPSDRMLRKIGKGFTTEALLDTLRICHEHGVPLNGNVMLGWNDLVPGDIAELEGFLESMPEGALTSVQVRWLFAHPYTEIHETRRGEPMRLGPFYIGFDVEVDPEQRVLNREATALIQEYGERKRFRIEGLANAER